MIQAIKFPSGVFFTPKAKMVDSLFVQGGTASGYFIKTKKGVTFYDMQDNPFLHLVANSYSERFFVSCSESPSEGNRIRYMFGVCSSTGSFLGFDKLSYSECISFAENIWKQINQEGTLWAIM